MLYKSQRYLTFQNCCLTIFFSRYSLILLTITKNAVSIIFLTLNLHLSEDWERKSPISEEKCGRLNAINDRRSYNAVLMTLCVGVHPHFNLFVYFNTKLKLFLIFLINTTQKLHQIISYFYLNQKIC